MDETLVNLTLEVVNSFEFPRQQELLTQELAEMSRRLEEDPDYTEEDEFIVATMEGDYTGEHEQAPFDFYEATIRKLSQQFPDLVFALDFHEYDPDDHEDDTLLFRWYFQDGKRHIVEPEVIVPEFDPKEAE